MEGMHALHTAVVVATVQSLTPEATQDLLAANAMPVLTVLIDEAHHAIPGWLFLNARITALRLVGKNLLLDIMFTPTPVRIWRNEGVYCQEPIPLKGMGLRNG